MSLIYAMTIMGFERLLLMFFLWKGVLCADEEIHKYYNVTVRSPVTAQEGLCVLIPCGFTIENTTEPPESPRGYWFIDGTRIDGPAVASNDGNKEIYLEARGRFTLEGNVSRKNCSLRINDVRKWDARNYFFRYEHSQSSRIKYSYIYYPLTVTVADLQELPEMSLPGRVMEGETVTVECTAPGRCRGSAPDITWSPESQFEYRQSFYNITNPDGTRTYKSTVTFTALMEHNNTSLYCTAYFPAVGKSTTQRVTLTVEAKENTNSPNSPNLPKLIGGAVAGVVLLAVVCLLAWLMSYKVRKSRNAIKEAGDKKETLNDGLQIYSVADKTQKGPRTENSPPSGANAMNSKEEDMYENFRNDIVQYASVRFSRARPESTYRPLPEESLYSEVKVN